MPQSPGIQPSVPRTDAELSEFLLRACHDLRGPLRAIRAHAELLLKDAQENSQEEPPKPLEFIVGGSSQVSALIDGLTDFSIALQIDPASFEAVPTNLMLRMVLSRMANAIREAGVEVKYDSLPTVNGNSDRIMQLFEHLLDYSMRRRRGEPLKIEISATEKDEFWQFRLCDNNPPLEADYLEKIFKPFERLHGKERPGPGLAICRVIVERHGGKIWVQPGTADSTVFCFSLPAQAT